MKFGMGIADDADSYMDAPQLPQGGGGGGGDGGFIANLLDLVGIHHQVAAAPKAGKVDKNASTAQQQVQPDILSAPEPSNRPTSRDMLDSSYTPIFANQMLDSLTLGLKKP